MLRRGFTLLEMLAVVAISGLLSSFAVMAYVQLVERGYKRQARDILTSLVAGEQTYHTVHDTYLALDPASPEAGWEAIQMQNPNPSDGSVVYTVTNVAGSGVAATCTATATRRGRQLTLDQQGAFGGSW